MPVILPKDPTYEPHRFFLGLFSVIPVKFLLSPTSSRLTIVCTYATLELPTFFFLVLLSRHVTIQRALARRLSLSAAAYRKAMSFRTVLPANGLSTIFWMLLSTTLLSNLPPAFVILMEKYAGGAPAWAIRAAPTLLYFFAAVQLTVVVVCSVMMATQDEVKVDFVEAVEDDDIPLLKLSAMKKQHGKETTDWVKVASTSRRHDVWVKCVPLPNGDDVGVYEMTTRLASNHPLFNPDKQAESTAPTLRISLP